MLKAQTWLPQKRRDASAVASIIKAAGGDANIAFAEQVRLNSWSSARQGAYRTLLDVANAMLEPAALES